MHEKFTPLYITIPGMHFNIPENVNHFMLCRFIFNKQTTSYAHISMGELCIDELQAKFFSSKCLHVRLINFYKPNFFLTKSFHHQNFVLYGI